LPPNANSNFNPPSLDGLRCIKAQFVSGKDSGLSLRDIDDEGGGLGGVSVSEVALRSQAARNGRILAGDKLLAVGSVPIQNAAQGIDLINSTPSPIVSLTFEKAHPSSGGSSTVPLRQLPPPSQKYRSRIQHLGSCSESGQRKFNEDGVVTRTLGCSGEKTLLCGAVFDGHGGGAASIFCQQEFPRLLDQNLKLHREVATEELLRLTWSELCDNFLESGSKHAADYDTQFGKIKGWMTASGLASGTTATVGLLNQGKFHLLNCGNSRAVVYDEEGNVLASTRDHRASEAFEAERLELGGFPPAVRGVDGNMRVRVKVEQENGGHGGESASANYLYGASRSLEAGREARDAGIVHSADLQSVEAPPGSFCLLATDGFWDAFDRDRAGELCSELLRESVLSINEVTALLCKKAADLGSVDSCSCVLMLN
jgi:serine/threonine protein phosphatase PrpC